MSPTAVRAYLISRVIDFPSDCFFSGNRQNAHNKPTVGLFDTDRLSVCQGVLMAKSIDKGPTTRQRIVQLATRRFAGQGYAGTSVEGLLDELGISRGALYHHFRAKEELFEAVLEAIEAELAQGVVTAVRGVADPVDRLRAGCAAWLRLAQDAAIRQVVLIDAPAVL